MQTPRPIYKLRRHKRIVVALILFVLPTVSLYSLKSVLGATTYSVTAAPGSIMEGQSTTLTLTITGAVPNTPYTFNINVTQPDSTFHGTTLTFTTNGTGYGTGPTTYPGSFDSPTPGNTYFLGTYSITVNQVSPLGALNPVATGSFTVGITDKTTFQRTNTVLIQAAGYGNRESATVDIASGVIHATGYPKVVMATSSGLVIDNWHIPVDAGSGTWLVSVAGTTTTKAPADQQQITVNPAALIVTVSTDQSSYARTQTITAYALVRYPDGTILNSSYPLNTNARVRVTFMNGSNTRTMSWNATAQNWYATWTVSGFIPASSLPQIWNVQVTADDREPNTPSNNGTGGPVSVTIRLVPSNPDLEITVMNSTGLNVAGVFLNITFANGTMAAQGATDPTGNAFFTLPTAYSYWVVASAGGYNDYLDTLYLQGTLMHRVYTLSSILYSGTVLSGSYTTQAHYNPGESGQLIVWIYNQNATFSITISKIEVQFPWFATYGNSYQGNVSVVLPNGPLTPKTNWNTTVPFTVPNDGRIYAGSRGTIYISATADAWKTTWVINKNGNPVSSKTLGIAYINPYKFGNYAGQGFIASDIVTISFPTQDTAAGSELTVIEVLSLIFLANIALLVLIWLRLKPLGKIASMSRV